MGWREWGRRACGCATVRDDVRGVRRSQRFAERCTGAPQQPDQPDPSTPHGSGPHAHRALRPANRSRGRITRRTPHSRPRSSEHNRRPALTEDPRRPRRNLRRRTLSAQRSSTLKARCMHRKAQHRQPALHQHQLQADAAVLAIIRRRSVAARSVLSLSRAQRRCLRMARAAMPTRPRHPRSRGLSRAANLSSADRNVAPRPVARVHMPMQRRHQPRQQDRRGHEKARQPNREGLRLISQHRYHDTTSKNVKAPHDCRAGPRSVGARFSGAAQTLPDPSAPSGSREPAPTPANPISSTSRRARASPPRPAPRRSRSAPVPRGSQPRACRQGSRGATQPSSRSGPGAWQCPPTRAQDR